MPKLTLLEQIKQRQDELNKEQANKSDNQVRFLSQWQKCYHKNFISKSQKKVNTYEEESKEKERKTIKDKKKKKEEEEDTVKKEDNEADENEHQEGNSSDIDEAGIKSDSYQLILWNAADAITQHW